MRKNKILMMIISLAVVSTLCACSQPVSENVTNSDSEETVQMYEEVSTTASEIETEEEVISVTEETEDANMQNEIFSYFEGKYIATPEDHNGFGGGEKLDPLVLNEDGSIHGGGAHYQKVFYPDTVPVFVEKQDDGTYLCQLNEKCYYMIYPVGVIQDTEYVLENQAYLKDVVYIRCFVLDGGLVDIIYYSDSISHVVTDYSGNDWLPQEAYTEEIGQKIVSGTGIEYTVVAMENNFDVGGGRIRMVLETIDGNRWMIPNLPNFQYDERTEIIYFDIYEYVSHPDYSEYN